MKYVGIGLVVLFILVIAAMRLQDLNDTKELTEKIRGINTPTTSTVYWANLKVEDCFDRSKLPSSFTYIETVDCVDGNANTQVIRRVRAGSESEIRYPGVDRLIQIGLDNCQSHSNDFYFPDTSDWNSGYRVIICVIFY